MTENLHKMNSRGIKGPQLEGKSDIIVEHQESTTYEESNVKERLP